MSYANMRIDYMKKSIWIFNHYGCTPNTGALLRHFNFGKNLIKNDYLCTVFVSNQLHYKNDIIPIRRGKQVYKDDEGVPFVFIKTSPYKGNGLSRVLNMYSYYKNLFPVTKKYFKQNGKPDIILASSVHPLALIAGIKIAKKHNIPCICEVRDLWPESIFEYGSLKKNSLLGKILQAGEKWIYIKADRIIFTMQGGYDYIIEQGWQEKIPKEKCFYINNGVDLETFDYNKENYIVEDEDLKNDDIFKIIYTGSVRRVNNLKIIVDVAKELKENEKIKFLIWGDGDELEELRGYIKDKKHNNIVFKGYIEKKYIPYILSRADVNLSHCEYKSISRFGTSRNKNFDYLASGKPILCTEKVKYDIFLESDSGIVIEEQITKSIKNAVLCFYNIKTKQKEQYIKMCRNARKKVLEYDFNILTKKLIEIIEN